MVPQHLSHSLPFGNGMWKKEGMEKEKEEKKETKSRRRGK